MVVKILQIHLKQTLQKILNYLRKLYMDENSYVKSALHTEFYIQIFVCKISITYRIIYGFESISKINTTYEFAFRV